MISDSRREAGVLSGPLHPPASGDCDRAPCQCGKSPCPDSLGCRAARQPACQVAFTSSMIDKRPPILEIIALRGARGAARRVCQAARSRTPRYSRSPSPLCPRVCQFAKNGAEGNHSHWQSEDDCERLKKSVHPRFTGARRPLDMEARQKQCRKRAAERA